MSPQVSVVIPVKNEAAKIRACIEGILAQTVPVKEIIVLDSGSTDGTLEILHGYRKVKVINILPSEFNHGETRNVGVRHATGEFVLLTVGDAKAYDSFWIQHLLDGFDRPNVAGVCGQQICAHEKDKNPVDWFRPIGLPQQQCFAFSKEQFASLTPIELLSACGWDDVTAMYRREILLKIPFRRTSYSEDAIWAKEALKAGHAIVYNTAARVYHYHIEDADFTFKRSLTTLYMRYTQFGYAAPLAKTSLRKQLAMYKVLGLTKGLGLFERWKWVQYNRQQQKAERKAHMLFLQTLAQGREALDLLHEKYCGKPPIPVKASAKVTA